MFYFVGLLTTSGCPWHFRNTIRSKFVESFNISPKVFATQTGKHMVCDVQCYKFRIWILGSWAENRIQCITQAKESKATFEFLKD